MAKSKGNINNLKPFKTVEEAREKGRIGGLKAQQNIRQRKKARECMEMILAMKATGKNGKKMMSDMGIKEEEQQNIMLLMTTLFAKAASTGDPNAIKSVLEIAGELNESGSEQTPTININIFAATPDDIEEE